jgi:hypothetical protein
MTWYRFSGENQSFEDIFCSNLEGKIGSCIPASLIKHYAIKMHGGMDV